MLIYVHSNELLIMNFEHIRDFALRLETGNVFTWEFDFLDDFNRMRTTMIPSSRGFNDKELF